MTSDRPLMLQPGAAIADRYEIVAMLGEGAMGAVYEATERGTMRGVAIKVLHPQFARVPDMVRRFGLEAKAAADVGHPGVVEVFDRGTHGGTAFLVMPLLRGETLSTRLLREGRLAPEAAVEIVGRVLSTLAAVHAKGIIHRDLKPENVFLEAAGAGAVKLIDFGVSKFRREKGAIDQSTLEGTLFGTPGYMAPEQCMGQRDIDHRADLFAAGAILYELLTGRLPFVGAHRGELFLEVVRGTTPPDPPGRLAPGVPEALDGVVLRALERDRARRFGSAREFLDALRPFGAAAIDAVSLPPMAVALDDEPTAPSTRPPRPTRPPRRLPSRRWRILGPAAAALLVALALAALAARPASLPSGARGPAAPAPARVEVVVVPEAVSCIGPEYPPDPDAPGTTLIADAPPAARDPKVRPRVERDDRASIHAGGRARRTPSGLNGLPIAQQF